MQKPDPYGEWVISGSTEAGEPLPVDAQLLAAARATWPHVAAYARRELAPFGQASESNTLAAEVWERLLRSVSRTFHRNKQHVPPEAELQPYLMGAFRHRFNRVLKRERRRTTTIQLLASAEDLERLPGARDSRWTADLERTITISQIAQHMDQWTRAVWAARQVGYSWKEIAKRCGLKEDQTRMRFQYRLQKTRERILNTSREEAR
jgi:DNA-directed RNA polymerase specialized sigma24 family protein